MSPLFCRGIRRLNKEQLSCSNSASHSLVFCCAFSLPPFYPVPHLNTDRSWEYVSTIDYEWDVWTSSQRFLGTIWVSAHPVAECRQRVFSSRKIYSCCRLMSLAWLFLILIAEFGGARSGCRVRCRSLTSSPSCYDADGQTYGIDCLYDLSCEHYSCKST